MRECVCGCECGKASEEWELQGGILGDSGGGTASSSCGILLGPGASLHLSREVDILREPQGLPWEEAAGNGPAPGSLSQGRLLVAPLLGLKAPRAHRPVIAAQFA